MSTNTELLSGDRLTVTLNTGEVAALTKLAAFLAVNDMPTASKTLANILGRKPS